MKKILLFSSLIIFCLSVFISCSEKPSDGNKKLTAPVISALETTVFTLTEKPEDFVYRMTWSKAIITYEGVADKGVDFKYDVEYDLSGFSSPKILKSTSNIYFDVNMGTLSTIYETLDESGKENPVVAAIRVKAIHGEDVVLSEPVMITIYPVKKEPEPRIPTSVDKPVFNPLPSSEFRLSDPGEQDVALVTVTWKAPVFHFGDKTGTITPLTYDVEFDSANNQFARRVILGSSSSASITLYHRQIQEMLSSWGAKPLMGYDAELRIKASYGSGETAGVVYSDILSIRFIPYATFSATQLMWMIGDFNNWNISNLSSMWPLFKSSNSAEDGIYVYTGYIPAESGFKFLPEMSIGSYLCFCNDDSKEGHLVLSESPDGAFWNETAGFKSITLDTKAMTYKIESYDVSTAKAWNSIGFIGTFTNWSSDVVMEKASSENCHIWVKEMSMERSSADYHCGKFRAEGTWENIWNNIIGKEWDTPFGTMRFSASPDVNIYTGPEAGDFYVAFNDLTSQFIFYRKH